MRTKLKTTVALSCLTLILVAVVMLKTDPIVNWVTSHNLHREPDAAKRIIIINMTLGYSPEFWNPQYLQEASRADTQLERNFIADLIHERYATNAIPELQKLLTSQPQESSSSNINAIITRLENIKKRG